MIKGFCQGGRVRLERIGWSLVVGNTRGNRNGVFVIIKDCTMMIFSNKKNYRNVFFSWLWSFGEIGKFVMEVLFFLVCFWDRGEGKGGWDPGVFSLKIVGFIVLFTLHTIDSISWVEWEEKL